jgi:hypothetical protein
LGAEEIRFFVGEPRCGAGDEPRAPVILLVKHIHQIAMVSSILRKVIVSMKQQKAYSLNYCGFINISQGYSINEEQKA